VELKERVRPRIFIRVEATKEREPREVKIRTQSVLNVDMYFKEVLQTDEINTILVQLKICFMYKVNSDELRLKFIIFLENFNVPTLKEFDN
jgi:hypothetical protein